MTPPVEMTKGRRFFQEEQLLNQPLSTAHSVAHRLHPLYRPKTPSALRL
jgi:hypothetical protein